MRSHESQLCLLPYLRQVISPIGALGYHALPLRSFETSYTESRTSKQAKAMRPQTLSAFAGRAKIRAANRTP